jgi:hypothetical protein
MQAQAGNEQERQQDKGKCDVKSHTLYGHGLAAGDRGNLLQFLRAYAWG